MNQLYRNAGLVYRTVTKRYFASSGVKLSNTNVQQFEPVEIIDPPESLQLEKLNYDRRRNDPIDVKKARLLYQSRKRGMLENGLLLSTFAAKYLDNMNEIQIDEYDKIINLPSNDWDIFYWAMDMKPTPEQFDNPVMKMLKDHVKNIEREIRTRQPDLQF